MPTFTEETKAAMEDTDDKVLALLQQERNDSTAFKILQAMFGTYDVKLHNEDNYWRCVIYKDATHYEGTAFNPQLAIFKAACEAF